MACAVGDEDFPGEHKTKGLATNHAYTLIGAYSVQGNQLVKVRNPWGSYEWKGAWHDKDPKWTNQIKKEVGFVGGEDGIFYMSIGDYKEEFGSTTICKVNDKYHYKFVSHEKRDEGNLTKFFVNGQGPVWVTVS